MCLPRCMSPIGSSIDGQLGSPNIYHRLGREKHFHTMKWLTELTALVCDVLADAEAIVECLEGSVVEL